jgi:hypothetical protein
LTDFFVPLHGCLSEGVVRRQGGVLEGELRQGCAREDRPRPALAQRGLAQRRSPGDDRDVRADRDAGGEGLPPPDGPYVEFERTVEEEEARSSLLDVLQRRLDGMVGRDEAVAVESASAEELAAEGC